MTPRKILVILILAVSLVSLPSAENIKAIGSVAKANIKSVGSVAEANIKAFGPVDNTASGGGGGPPTFVRAANAKQGAGSTLTITSFQSDGSNRGLIVGVCWYGSGITISSITFNGGAQSLSQTIHSGWVDANGKIAIWELVAPAAATADIVITFSGSAGEAVAVAYLVNNANQTDLVGDSDVDHSTSNRSLAQVNLTTAVDDLAIDFLGYYSDTATFVADAPEQTEPAAGQANNTGTTASLHSSYETATGTTTNMRWDTTSGSTQQTLVSAVVNKI